MEIDQIMIFPKPDKPLDTPTTSYKSINRLLFLSKIHERLIPKQIFSNTLLLKAYF